MSNLFINKTSIYKIFHKHKRVIYLKTFPLETGNIAALIRFRAALDIGGVVHDGIG